MGESYRTRLLPELIKKLLIKDGISEEIAQVVGKVITRTGRKKEKKESKEKKPKKSKKERKDEKLITKQSMFFSSYELIKFAEILKKKIGETNNPEEAEKALIEFDFEKEMKKSGLQPITPDIALFGRMVTSEAFPNIQASIQVAHALSTNKLEQEFDYFTAVDDLIPLGASILSDAGYNSACYYKYFSLDFDELIKNMNVSGVPKNDLADVVVAFLSAAVFTTPSGKQNSFAAHQLPDGILIEIRNNKIPVSYANAFIKPIISTGGKDLIEMSLEKFSGHVKDINEKYGLTAKSRQWFCTQDIQIKDTTKCDTFQALSINLKNTLVA